jgi:hypothetical protein
MKVVGPVHVTGAVSAHGTLELVATRAPDPGWGN